ncbi:MAG: FHA domain-containing protein [Thermoanaerobaculia bacterium]
MIIECSSCAARYQYEVGRFEGKLSKKIRCAKCQQVFEIKNPDLAEPAAAVAAAAPAPEPAVAAAPAADATPPKGVHPDAGDMTMSRERQHAPAPVADADAPHSTRPPGELQIPKDRRFAVAITDGTDAGKVFRIENPRVTIGRTGAAVPLDDAEVSREHAAIEVRNSVVLLKDLGSTNGTFVNGKRITADYELQNQDEFVVGVTTLMLIVTWSE